MTWGKEYGDPYHNENRCIRTQLYNKNIIHLSYQKYTSQSSYSLREIFPLCGINWKEGHQSVSTRNSSAQQEVVLTLVHLSDSLRSHCPSVYPKCKFKNIIVISF